VRKEDGVRPANPFDYGAGRVDLTRAGLAGLVLRETGDKFLAADPEAGGDPTTLNLPSLANGDCEGKCSWTRVVTSTLAADAAWTVKVVAPRGVAITVSPDRFTLPPGGSQTLTVTADVARAPTGKWLFGELRLATKGGAPAAHLPIAVLPGGSPTPVNIETASSTGTHSVTVTSNIDITRFSSRVSGLAEGKVVNEQVVQDPTMLEPYDTPVGTVHTLVNVPAGSRLLAAEVTDTTSSDVDLFVGIDSDKDGQPDESEEVCRSASEIAIGESCRLKDPAGGSYWVMVQNWLLGQPPADDVELVVSVVPGTDNGNLSVSAPQTVPAGQPFTIGLAWNEPAMNPGSTWFALVEYGADAKRPSNAGSLLVRISRTS
jgi:hypothetical protein